MAVAFPLSAGKMDLTVLILSSSTSAFVRFGICDCDFLSMYVI